MVFSYKDDGETMDYMAQSPGGSMENIAPWPGEDCNPLHLARAWNKHLARYNLIIDQDSFNQLLIKIFFSAIRWHET
mgnify:CR=1 FL=1